MKNYQRLLIFILFCVSFSINAQQEKREFNIIQDQKTIGTAIATKTVEGTKTTYSDDTNMVIHMLAKI